MERYNLSLKGVLHIGAHECEELDTYVNDLGVSVGQIYWVDALSEKVIEAKTRGISNIYHAVLDKEERYTTFNVSSFKQSSSLLAFKEHTTHYPDIRMNQKRSVKTQTLQSFGQKHKVPIETLNFWNLDIQGSELDVLKGAGELLKHADVLYLEVNDQELYKGGCLVGQLDSYLASYGFNRVHTVMTDYGWGDGIYVREVSESTTA